MAWLRSAQADSSDSGTRHLVLIRLLALMCALLGGVSGAASSQPVFDQPITGRDFAGLDLPVQPQSGDAILEARGGWAWADGDARRLLLHDEVRVRLGGYDFRADRAVVWIEPRQTDAGRVWYLAFYFENLRTPLASARFSQSARRLLVTAAVTGKISLRVALLQQGRPEDDSFLAESESRLARRLQTLIAQGAPQTPVTGFGGGIDRSFYEAAGEPAPLDPDAPIFPHRGVVTFDGPDRTLITGKDENALVITGGAVVEYTDVDAGRTLQLTAQNAVVFLDPSSVADTLKAGPGEVHGVYLEGAVVATDGEFTIRGPRVYYDVQHDRAAMLDAVFYTYDERRSLPLYVRADVIRQESLGQWEAHRATLSNVGFAEPRLSIGVKNLRLTRARRADGSSYNLIAMRGASLRLGRAPVFPLPNYRGDISKLLLPSVRVGSKDGNAFISTRWDFASVFGLDPSTPIHGSLLLDGYVSRGPAVGLNLAWATPDAFGSLLAYYIHDAGNDRLTTGADLAARRTNRGLILANHQWRINDQWKLALEGAYISDEAFTDAFFERLSEVGPETINRFALSRRGDQSLFLAQATGVIGDFSPNEFLLQSRGYQVQRLPELSYFRVGDAFAGGHVAYFSESRAGILKPSFVEPKLARFGFLSPALSQAGFGLNPGQSLGDGLRAGGFSEGEVTRVDSRHELTGAFDVGALRVNPFAIGRITLYDDSFGAFRAARGITDTRESRLWAAAGATVSTAIVREYNTVDSSFLDLHRLRHILEPSATVFTSVSTLDSQALPVFDESVESLAEGSALRVGLKSTWQTKRGGPGAWRNVDWLVLRAEYVYASSDTTRESSVGRFFQSRPELSRFGRFADAQATLALTDAIGVVGAATYDTENHDLDTANVGAIFDHGYGFTSFAEIRRINAGGIDSTFVNFGASYELSARYALAAAAVLDIKTSSVEALQFEVRRRYPQWTLEVGVNYDEVRQDVGLSIQLRPFGGPTDRLRNSLTRDRFFPGDIGAGAAGRVWAGSPYRP